MAVLRAVRRRRHVCRVPVRHRAAQVRPLRRHRRPRLLPLPAVACDAPPATRVGARRRRPGRVDDCLTGHVRRRREHESLNAPRLPVAGAYRGIPVAAAQRSSPTGRSSTGRRLLVVVYRSSPPTGRCPPVVVYRSPPPTGLPVAAAYRWPPTGRRLLVAAAHRSTGRRRPPVYRSPAWDKRTTLAGVTPLHRTRREAATRTTVLFRKLSFVEMPRSCSGEMCTLPRAKCRRFFVLIKNELQNGVIRSWAYLAYQTKLNST